MKTGNHLSMFNPIRVGHCKDTEIVIEGTEQKCVIY